LVPFKNLKLDNNSKTCYSKTHIGKIGHNMNEATATEIGLSIVSFLDLKPLRGYEGDPAGERYYTDCGPKTLAGLGRTICRVADYARRDEFTNDETL
jgi:hypothetical protein